LHIYWQVADYPFTIIVKVEIANCLGIGAGNRLEIGPYTSSKWSIFDFDSGQGRKLPALYGDRIWTGAAQTKNEF
jgi:hypothetical protein